MTTISIDANTLSWLALVALCLFVTQAVTLYAVVRIFTTGRAVAFERKDRDRGGLVVGLEGRG